MADTRQIQPLPSRSRWLPLIAVALTLIILAAVIVSTTLLLRAQIRAQMAALDGRVLHAVAQIHAAAIQTELADLGGLEDPDNQLLAVLETTRLNPVLGARLFDPEGRFVESFPPDLLEARLNPEDVTKLKSRQPLSRLYPSIALHNLFYSANAPVLTNASTLPILEVNVPLHASAQGELVGIAQFLIEGERLGEELARLDRHLWRLALVVFLASGSLLVLALGSAFQRLRGTQSQLADRTDTLLRANQELALVAKTSAVGAVASHLIHGLKNPLSGLQNFVTTLGDNPGGTNNRDWEEAVASTRRMQTMINQVVGVLREEETSRYYQVSPRELFDIVQRNVQPLLDAARVSCVTHIRADEALTNREAQLLNLILVNLVQNAAEATPAEGKVSLSAVQHEQGLILEVADEGPGFPAALRDSLFSPCASGKEGGSGIGLAISKLLANHLGARLDLRQSTAAGCVFRLLLPPPSHRSHSKVASSDVLG